MYLRYCSLKRGEKLCLYLSYYLKAPQGQESEFSEASVSGTEGSLEAVM